MRMSDFIEKNLDAILDDWDEFAERQRPASKGMTQQELRDFAREILESIVNDMRGRQSARERHEKSRGVKLADRPEDVEESARAHAAERLVHGFTLNQLIAEYRALRASVIRRWRAELRDCGEKEMEQVTRFNEAVDESMAEAVGWYHARIEDARDLLNGVLAHDLRSPLGAILASVEVLLQDDSLDAKQSRIAIRMRNSANRLKRMISDLLDFTRTRLGTGLPMALGNCNMASMIRDVCEEQKAFHPSATMSCETHGNLSAHWDQERIEQMLANLIGNAIEHGGQESVTVIACGHSDEVTVDVHNQGRPIPEYEQRVVFDPLRRAVTRGDGDSSADAGIGLGLYIARQIAEAHGGNIEVVSSEDAGTTFTVRLPRRPREGSRTAGLT